MEKFFLACLLISFVNLSIQKSVGNIIIAIALLAFISLSPVSYRLLNGNVIDDKRFIHRINKFDNNEDENEFDEINGNYARDESVGCSEEYDGISYYSNEIAVMYCKQVKQPIEILKPIYSSSEKSIYPTVKPLNPLKKLIAPIENPIYPLEKPITHTGKPVNVAKVEDKPVYKPAYAKIEDKPKYKPAYTEVENKSSCQPIKTSGRQIFPTLKPVYTAQAEDKPAKNQHMQKLKINLHTNRFM